MKPVAFLEKIKILTQDRILQARRERPLELLQAQLPQARQTFDFAARLNKKNGPQVIAEVKRQSPSLGKIAMNLVPVEVAQAYDRAGAAAVSVLTEPTHFGGSINDLRLIRAALPQMPLLQKDFVIDPYQLFEARIAGADAILLIHALLGENDLRKLLAQAQDLGLSALVEVHSEEELESAVKFGARLIGVNNRNLNTLQTDLGTSERLAQIETNPAVTMVAESGLENAAQIRHLSSLGYKAFLMGTKLMLQHKPEKTLGDLLTEIQ